MKRYKLEHSSTRPNGWVLTDTENGIVITFDNRKYNETQTVTFLADNPLEGGKTAHDIAHMLQEMGQWLYDHHVGTALNVTYGIEHSEDDTKAYICRYKYPRWRLEVLDDNGNAHGFAGTLSKAAEWLHKRAGQQTRQG